MPRMERCRICGDEWPFGARTECPKYRDADHRRFRTNVRGQDVMVFDKLTPPVEVTEETSVEPPELIEWPPTGYQP